MVRPKVGIAGAGWVGGTLLRYFKEILGYRENEELFVYDVIPEKCVGGINAADVIFITVPTPIPASGACDTSMVESAISTLLREKIVVIKSTVPPGTTERMQAKFPQHKMLFNPEFLTESRAWEDMVRPDRQIVGYTKKSMDAAHLVLSLLPTAPFMSPWGIGTYEPIRITATEAEMIKYAGNVFFSMKVSYANAFAMLAEKMGCDYENIRKAISAEYRIGGAHTNVNHGGYKGFGGTCLPKDTYALKETAREQGLLEVYNLLQSFWEFNANLLKSQGLTIAQVSKHFGEDIR